MSASSAFTTGSGLQDVNRANVTDIGQIYKSNVNLTMVDPGAIAAGSELAGLGILAAGDAMDAVSDVMGELLPWSATENDRNRAFAGQGATMVADAARNAVAVVANAGSAVLKFATGESELNRAFAGQASQMAVDAAERASADTIQFVAGESDRNRAFAGQAVAEIGSANRAALDAVQGGFESFTAGFDKTADRAFSFAGGAVSASNAHIAGLVGAVTKNSIQSIETLSEASRSDAAKSLDKVMLMAAVMVGLIMWRKGF